MENFLVLPRPGKEYPSLEPIPAPSEEAFTATFGTLLPRAQYLQTPIGKAAYYVFPSSPTPTQSPPSNAPSRVLLIHGVQTPALGLLPLTTALRGLFPGTEFALLDLWGHGLSETPVRPHEGSLFQGLVDGVLKELGWRGKAGVGIVGFSFGSVVTMGWLTEYAAEEGSKGVDSFVLVAPAGLLRRSWFTPEQLGWLGGDCSPRDEERASDFVVRTLEGGPLVVPGDWKERLARGEVVAQAIKEWQMKQHGGHAASVVGVFRDGGVLENDELFRKARKTGVPALVVLGAEDDLSTEEEIRGFGFDVRVVKDAGHSVVRDRAEEVAEHIGDFWRRL